MNTIKSTPDYIAKAQLLLSKEDSDTVSSHLSQCPGAFPLIPGTTNLRDHCLVCGQSGGGRRVHVVYYYRMDTSEVFLVNVFSEIEYTSLSNKGLFDLDRDALDAYLTLAP